MSSRSTRKKASSNLLNPLETMKSEEFGEPIEEISNSSDSCFTTPTHSSKRKIDSVDLYGAAFKLDETDDGFEDSISKPETGRQKRSRLKMEEHLKLKQETTTKFVQSFVKVSEQYAHFLAKKIDTKGNRDKKVLSKKRDDNTTNGAREHIDITKKLKHFVGTLRPYQIEGVTWLTVLFENSVNGILADEMGLGKTIQIIALFCHLYERKVEGPYLIVAPLSTLGNWEAEFKKFAPEIPVVRLQGTVEDRQAQMKKIMTKVYIDERQVKPVVLCSYQTPQLESRFLRQYRWKYIVVDEGHRIKNAESQLSLELRALKSENRTLLTGTPLQNDIKELWALVNFLMPDLFNDIDGFSMLLELDDLKDKDKILENEAQTKVISTIHKVLAPFMLRREKKYVLRDLVPKREMIIYCSLTELQSYLYRTVLAKDSCRLMMEEPVYNKSGKAKRSCTMQKVETSPETFTLQRKSYNMRQLYSVTRYEDIENTPLDKEPLTVKERKVYPKNVPVDILKCYYMTRITMQNLTVMLRKIVNHPYLIWCPLSPNTGKNNEMYVTEDLVNQSGKLLLLDNLLPRLKAQGHKVLLFSTSTMFMDIIEEFLIMRNFNYRRLDGSVSYDDRNVSIDAFQNDPEVFIFMLSTRAGGLGLNLTSADTVIFMDRDWNPMVDLQAQDRCHRIGQTKPVMIYSLIAKGTIDEAVVARGDIKKRLERLIIQEGKFKTMKRVLTDTELGELRQLLDEEEKLTKINANGLIYTDKEVDQILDRTELIAELKKIAKNETSTSAKN